MAIMARVTWGCEPEEVSMLHAIRYVKAAGGLGRMLDVEGGAQQDRFPGGTQQIALRIASRERRRGTQIELPPDISILDEARDPALAAAIRSLPPQRRLVLFLRYYADFTYGEIAEALGIAEGTVAATLSQARSALLDELMSEEVAR